MTALAYRLEPTPTYLNAKARLSAADQELVDAVEARLAHDPGPARHRHVPNEGWSYDFSESPIIVSYRVLDGNLVELLAIADPGHHGRIA